MSFIISFGKYGGFYYHSDYHTRICLGWVAFTYLPEDYDDMLSRILSQTSEGEAINKNKK